MVMDGRNGDETEDGGFPSLLFVVDPYLLTSLRLICTLASSLSTAPIVPDRRGRARRVFSNLSA